MKIRDIKYPVIPGSEHALPFFDILMEATDDISRYAKLGAELGLSEESERLVAHAQEELDRVRVSLDNLVNTAEGDPTEPEAIDQIKALRPAGMRRISRSVPTDYAERLRGALLGRFAGCTLGAAVEFLPVPQIEAWGKTYDGVFPPTDYFSAVRSPGVARYFVGDYSDLARDNISFVPVDDDTAYTLIGLLTVEEYGPDFTTEQQADVWMKNIPLVSPENHSWGAYWGERILLQNLHRGLDPRHAGFTRNPNVQSIAAWTRADSWGYMCPGWPEKAAELAFRDASINHRRNGVYGSMFFAATIAAAFVVDDPVEALHIGLQEIPAESLLAEGVNWAIAVAPEVESYRDVARLISERYHGMFEGHAVNNALNVVFGVVLGKTDFTRVIGETVAMGLDNDCTGATAGSIVGATVGRQGIPSHWVDPFQGRVQSYLKTLPEFVGVEELVERFEVQAMNIAKG